MQPDPLVISGCLLLGLVLGSFGNVVIARVPEGGSLSTPPSTCPRCGTAIRPYDNVPVLSWLLLRGRCRACDEAISVEYPLVGKSYRLYRLTTRVLGRLPLLRGCGGKYIAVLEKPC